MLVLAAPFPAEGAFCEARRQWVDSRALELPGKRMWAIEIKRGLALPCPRRTGGDAGQQALAVLQAQAHQQLGEVQVGGIEDAQRP
jgi:hypothetical protein